MSYAAYYVLCIIARQVLGMRYAYLVSYTVCIYIYMHLVSFGGMYSVDTVCTVYDCINCISANEQKAVDGVVNI